jgi:hypothetical protein
MGVDEPQFSIKPEGGFEFHNVEEGDPPHLAAPVYAAELAQAFASEPLWLASEGWQISPAGPPTASLPARVAFVGRKVGAHVDGEVVLSADPSGWVKVEIYLGHFRVFIAFLDRVWEEFDLWPSGAADFSGDEPGRIGKRKNWVNLSVKAWPQLGRLTGDDYFSINLPET